MRKNKDAKIKKLKKEKKEKKKNKKNIIIWNYNKRKYKYRIKWNEKIPHRRYTKERNKEEHRYNKKKKKKNKKTKIGAKIVDRRKKKEVILRWDKKKIDNISKSWLHNEHKPI